MSTTSPLKTGAELRRAFLDFFVRHGHVEVPSSPLVPHGDPTLMFTTAGMVQFKPYYTATGDVPYARATSVQKCLRLTDLDHVGLTPRHDTFFEMLGNFSFGPRAKGAYFKEEATAFAWEFVTKVLGLPKERLFVSIFGGEAGVPRDDEAAALWVKLGLPKDHLIALGRKDNFWGPAGGAGACGPCSELYFDLGDKRPDYLPKDAFWGEAPGDAGDRYMEFWNLVFPQFDAQPDGKLELLPNPGIDTGMGIERLALILQGKNTIFETDLFAPLVDSVLSRSKAPKANLKTATRDARIIADHVRALSFAIAEGALPGNEGAGYVLRRLLRRAVTRGRSEQGLALEGAFLADAAARAIDAFSGHYAELGTQRDRVLRLLEQEEASFGQTYEAGMERLEKLIAQGFTELSGSEAFALHDTYGFPFELTEEIAASRNLTVDRDGFNANMEAQRERARSASRFLRDPNSESRAWTTLTEGSHSQFSGYDATQAEGVSIRKWRMLDEDIEVVLDRTTAYPESGGQVSDTGFLWGGHPVKAGLVLVYREGEHIVHRVSCAVGLPKDLLESGRAAGLTLTVDATKRAATNRHHTATHLMHAALRTVFGEHVHQAGSLVAPDRLRFDYSHFESPSPMHVAAVEQRVNDWIMANVDVSWREMPIAEAKAQGAMALFGEKYGERVRMVTVAGVGETGIEPSRELCGGTHVRRTGDMGVFVITEETAVASGVRRIEALCGPAARTWLLDSQGTLLGILGLLQTPQWKAIEAVEKLKDEVIQLRKQVTQASQQGLAAQLAMLADGATVEADGRWVVARIDTGAETNAVRDAADQLRGKLGRGAAVLAIVNEEKFAFLAMVTDDLVAEKKLRADELVRDVARITGGSGGGKPHLSLAGGRDMGKLEEALDFARAQLKQALS